MKKFQMPKEFHSLNEGIPTEESNSKLHMDTHQQREGLHVWINEERDIIQEINGLQAELAERKKKRIKNTKMLRSFSVHLTRQDARNLVEEINHRLF